MNIFEVNLSQLICPWLYSCTCPEQWGHYWYRFSQPEASLIIQCQSTEGEKHKIIFWTYTTKQ